MAFIEIKEIAKSYGPRSILRDINLSIDEGEFVSIVGVSATGKTTLMKLVSGLLDADHGSVQIDGQPVSGFPNDACFKYQWHMRQLGMPEAQLTTAVDVSGYIVQKRDSITMHASQISDSSFFLKMPVELFARAFSTEWFIRKGAPPGIHEDMLDL